MAPICQELNGRRSLPCGTFVIVLFILLLTPSTVEGIILREVLDGRTSFLRADCGLPGDTCTICLDGPKDESECVKEKELENCVICLDGLREKCPCEALKNCGHQFHKACIGEWKLSNPTCPICRRTTTPPTPPPTPTPPTTPQLTPPTTPQLPPPPTQLPQLQLPPPPPQTQLPEEYHRGKLKFFERASDFNGYIVATSGSGVYTEYNLDTEQRKGKILGRIQTKPKGRDSKIRNFLKRQGFPVAQRFSKRSVREFFNMLNGIVPQQDVSGEGFIVTVRFPGIYQTVEEWLRVLHVYGVPSDNVNRATGEGLTKGIYESFKILIDLIGKADGKPPAVMNTQIEKFAVATLKDAVKKTVEGAVEKVTKAFAVTVMSTFVGTLIAGLSSGGVALGAGTITLLLESAAWSAAVIISSIFGSLFGMAKHVSMKLKLRQLKNALSLPKKFAMIVKYKDNLNPSTGARERSGFSVRKLIIHF